MTRAEIEYRIKCLNDEMFLDSPLELITLRTSTDYTYNKAIALVDKNSNKQCWYSVNY